jgi:DNA-binding response OmpR family regulator
VVAILLIEDDPLVRRGLGLALSRHGYEVRTAGTGGDGLRELTVGLPDLVILDLMLPDLDGFEVCRRVRAASEVPVIMLTARGDDFDVVRGLEVGADDYVIKPVRPTVLDARIRAVLRRGPGDPEGVRTHRDLRIDTLALTVSRNGEPLTLTPTELRLLLTLSRAPGRVFTRQQLLTCGSTTTSGIPGWSTTASSGCGRRSRPTRPPPNTCRPYADSGTGSARCEGAAMATGAAGPAAGGVRAGLRAQCRHHGLDGRAIGEHRAGHDDPA